MAYNSYIQCMTAIRLRKFFIVSAALPIIMVLLSVSSVWAEKPQKYHRPRIGLVLSGGGAKGLAHIGVLKVLEEAGIKPDYITGTSMGSIVGGLYASGYTARMLEQIMLITDWDGLLSDSVSRRSTSIDEKDGHDKYIGSLPIWMWGIDLPKGYKRGQKLTSLLSALTLPVHHITNFNHLPIPFRCIGTDIVTGQAVVLQSGNLADSMRASMAIPSIFTPIDINGHLLVDGGVIRNLPVQDARDMGADIIIAVDVGAPLYKREELTSIAQIMDQSVSFLGVISTRQQRKLADILIIPNIKGFSGSDFKRGRELIAVGEKAARLALPQLLKLAKEQGKYKREKKKSLPIRNIRSIYIKHIKIRGLKKVSENLVLGKLLLNVPKRVSPVQLRKAIARVYASRFFDRVTFHIEPVPGDPDEAVTLVISVMENTATFLKIGFSYDTEMRAALLLNTTIRNLLGQGSRLSIDARLSENPGFMGSYFIHTGWRKPGIGFGGFIHYDRYGIYTYSNGTIAASYDYQNYGADLILQAIILNSFAIAGGVQKDFTAIQSQISPGDPLKKDVESLNYYGYMMFDNLDRTFYPHSGFKFYSEAKYLTDDVSIRKHTESYKPFYKFTVKMAAFIPFGKYLSLYLGASGGFIMAREPYYLHYGTVEGWGVYRRKIPFVYQNYIGGLLTYKKDIFHFTGLNFMQISGENAIVGYIGLQIEPLHDKYLVLRGNVARVKENFYDLFKKRIRNNSMLWGQGVSFYEHLKNDLIYGFGFTLGMNTVIGPAELTIMRGSESDKFLLQVNVGYRIY